MSTFRFATCNPGWEGVLKAEVKDRTGGALVPAFLRPGLVTWKARDERGDGRNLPLPVFAHVFGRSLGLAKTADDLPGLVASPGPGMTRLHVIPRLLPENGFTRAEWAEIDERRDAIAASLISAGIDLAREETPNDGETVLDVVLGDPGEALFVGSHVHDSRYRPFAGGMPRCVLPDDAPSRAWLKMEQALAYAGFDGPSGLAGKTVLELGSAPGGGSLSLLGHGARVIGVDSGEMDERILAFAGRDGAGFVHLKASAGEIAFGDLPPRIDLLASDMNLAPPVALRYVERLQRRVRARALILTLKINDSRMESQIPAFLERIAGFAPGKPFATQLPANRKEITILARAERTRS